MLDSFDTINGIARLSSANADFDGMKFSVSIQCFSLDSLDDVHSETEKVIVDFELWDKCRQSTIEMPFIDDSYTERFLYEETFYRFEVGINSMGCGPIEHKLVGLPIETFAVIDPNVPEGSLDICTKATTHQELGIYDYVIEGCLTFPVDGYQICATTNDL